MTTRETGRARLLLISSDQLGYLTDSYQYCAHLRDHFQITYVGWDYDLPRITLEGIECMHLSRDGGKLRRYYVFLRQVMQIVREHPADIVFVEYFPLCALVPLFGGKRSRTVLDIRTGYVRNSVLMRVLSNGLMTLETLFFRHVMVISDSLRKFLCISSKKARILPLGADESAFAAKEFSALRLFYVGSLDYRHIDETVKGLGQFLRRHPGAPIESYDIVGFGSEEEEGRLRQAIEDAPPGPRIVFHGRKMNRELTPFLERCNVGVAFIPAKKHYQCQPATKTFEYLLAGMVVIATHTYENARVIDTTNGVLTDDSAGGFCQGLENLLERLNTYDSAQIRSNIGGYTWNRIVAENLLPFLTALLRKP